MQEISYQRYSAALLAGLPGAMSPKEITPLDPQKQDELEKKS